MNKSELRKIYLARQQNLSPIERKQRSEEISNQLFRAFSLNKINFLHCFIAIEKFNEIDTSPIFQKIWREFSHVETLVPRVNFQTKDIENFKFSSATKLVKNVWEIYEPIAAGTIAIEKIDAVLVPLLCFDANGFRVGYGKGFYDRFLTNCRTDCLKIGLSYFAPVEKITDTQPFDVKLDFCATPERVVNCKS